MGENRWGEKGEESGKPETERGMCLVIFFRCLGMKGDTMNSSPFVWWETCRRNVVICKMRHPGSWTQSPACRFKNAKGWGGGHPIASLLPGGETGACQR